MPANLLLACGLILSSLLSLDLSARAEEPALPLVPQPIRWVKGPANPALGSTAELNLPEGFRFVDGQAGRTMLESLKMPVPEGFLGVVSPSSGEWALTLAYTQNGHVQDGEWQKLDSDRLLKSIWDRTSEQNADRARQGLPVVAHVNWAMKPEYDGKLHLIQWAVAQDGNLERDKTIAYTGRLLGRRGVLEAKVIRRDSSDLGSVKDLVKKIRFKKGELYADYQPNDQPAVGGLAGIRTAKTRSAQKADAEEHTGSAQGAGATVFWFGLGAIAIVGLVSASFLAKKLRAEKAGAVKPVVSEMVAETPAKPANGARNGSAPRLNLKSGMVRPAVNGNGRANGHAKVNGNVNGKKRRIFNYEKFYTEMMLQGPAPVIGEPYAGFNGYNNGSNETNGTNGANGSNGYAPDNHQVNGNGHSIPKAASSDSHQMMAAHADLIASQKSFIEEQKRLIQEQARLIEEKSRLISEKNTLLDRQSQMIDSNLL